MNTALRLRPIRADHRSRRPANHHKPQAVLEIPTVLETPVEIDLLGAERVKSQWMYLYRAIDSDGSTVEFWFSKERDLNAAKCFIRRALTRHGRPERITVDGSQTNRSAIIQCDAQDRLRQDGGPIFIRSSKYLNNMIEQDHRRIK